MWSLVICQRAATSGKLSRNGKANVCASAGTGGGQKRRTAQKRSGSATYCAHVADVDVRVGTHVCVCVVATICLLTTEFHSERFSILEFARGHGAEHGATATSRGDETRLSLAKTQHYGRCAKFETG